MSFKSQRVAMVRDQIKSRGIKNADVVRAMLKVERDKFLPQTLVSCAYSDYPLPISCGQTISQPFMVGLMSECLKIVKNNSVLEIGTGSGYQTALLREMTDEVYTVERYPQLLERAENVLESLGYDDIHFKLGDGTLGWDEFAPYDRIIVTASAPSIPRSLFQQLKEEGRLIIPVGGKYHQESKIVVKKGMVSEEDDICGCVFVPLIGKEGWEE